MKRILSIALSVIVFTVTLSILPYIQTTTINAATTDWPSYPSLNSETAILLEASTGTILYDKKCHKKMYPASITKIMTALLTIENCQLDETVEFSQSAIDSLEYDAANIDAKVGEKLSVKDCLYALMLHSANEVATALGEHISGDITSFSKLMTERAQEVGATDTNFDNANGLFNKNHYVTAYDMAMITKAALSYPLFREIIHSTSYSIPKNNKRKDPLSIYQRHKMVWPVNAYYYEGIVGGKTGYTDQSGTTLVTCVERNGMTLIAVVLNAHGENAYSDTTNLFNYGFNNFNLVNVAENESRFSSNKSLSSSFDSVFGSNSDRLYISSEDNIVLPKKAKFADVTSNISFLPDDKQSKGLVATISYKYGDTPIGNSTIMYGSASKFTSGNVTSPETQKTITETATTNIENTTTDSGKKLTTSSEQKEKTQTTKKSSSSKSIVKNIIIGFVIICVIAFVTFLLFLQHKKLNKIRSAKRRRKY